MYKVVYTKRAKKDAAKIKQSSLADRTKELIDLLKEDPYRTPPDFEKLTGKLKGSFSRRINIQHRLVYQVYEQEKTVKILSMWTHYE